MNYEDFCHIASVCTEQIGLKCRRFFSPSNFMKFEKDESGRISILPFYLYVMRTVKASDPLTSLENLTLQPLPLTSRRVACKFIPFNFIGFICLDIGEKQPNIRK